MRRISFECVQFAYPTYSMGSLGERTKWATKYDDDDTSAKHGTHRVIIFFDYLVSYTRNDKRENEWSEASKKSATHLQNDAHRLAYPRSSSADCMQFTICLYVLGIIRNVCCLLSTIIIYAEVICDCKFRILFRRICNKWGIFTGFSDCWSSAHYFVGILIG